MKKTLMFIALVITLASCSTGFQYVQNSSKGKANVHAHNTKKHAHGIPVKVGQY